MSRFTKTSFAAAAMAAVAFGFATPQTSQATITLGGASVSGTLGTDFFVFEETSPGVLSNTSGTTANVNAALAGSPSAPGGNVELFANSETATFGNPNAGGAFATQTRTTLSGNLPANGPIAISSLNGSDWFTRADTSAYDTSFGAPTLANQYFADIATNFGLGAVLGLLPSGTGAQDAYNAFLGVGGFQRSSDPNISFVNENSGGDIEVGLAVSDFNDQVLAILAGLEAQNSLPPGTLTAALALGQAGGLIPADLEVSEVVLINGLPFYTFDIADSGLTTDDQTNSFGGVGVITVPGTGVIPEPITATLGVIALGGITIAAGRRNRGE